MSMVEEPEVRPGVAGGFVRPGPEVEHRGWSKTIFILL
jgi:hypothetical protein